MVVIASRGARHVAVGGAPVAIATGPGGPEVPVEGVAPIDSDQDGIPDTIDILIGAKKVALNGAHYKSTYRTLAFPGGDVPRDEGVCTDVVVRALRNAGIDLQKLLADDIQAAPGRYPMVRKRDRNIDHRRVRTLLPYFEHHWPAHDPAGAATPYLPGDIVFFDTLPAPGPDHIGVISDRLAPSGKPLVVNNWTDGFRASEMDLLESVTVTHRFRVPMAPLPVKAPHAGLPGILRRAGLAVAPAHRQVILVTLPTWTSSGGKLRRYDRSPGGFTQVGPTVLVRTGARGLGRGRGLHGKALGGLPPKREGDKKAPAGVFALGTAFGLKSRPYEGSWPYREVGVADRFVDDPASPHYNSWQRLPADGPAPWASAERMTMYDLGVVVLHNTPAEPGAGSAIFLHPWKAPTRPTVGCTSMERAHLLETLRWLDQARRPVMVQLAGSVF